MAEPRQSVNINTLMVVIAMIAAALLMAGWLLFPTWGW